MTTFLCKHKSCEEKRIKISTKQNDVL